MKGTSIFEETYQDFRKELISAHEHIDKNARGYKVTALYTQDYWLKTGGIATKDLKAPYAGEFTCATYDEAVAKVAELINEFKKAHDYCEDVKTVDDDAEVGMDDQNNIVFWNVERFFDDESGDYVDFCVYFEDI